MGSIKKEEKIYDALDVARLIINYAIAEGEPLINLKLQKLLYYTQAAFLVDRARPCFKEEIVHWRYGPAVEKVYIYYRGYGANTINERQEEIEGFEFDREKCDLIFFKRTFDSDEIFLKEDIKTIQHIVKGFKGVSPYQMIKQTQEEAPWLNTKQKEVIRKDDIRKYFSKNPLRFIN